MRKLAAVVLGAIFVVGSVIPAGAAGEEKRETTITVSIDPTYTVTIPADTSIESGTTSTSIGKIELNDARLEPDKSVYVSVDASGKLKNSKDSTKTIPYKVMEENKEFETTSYLKSGSSTPLTISINKSDWDNAYAGTYSDTLVFTVSYK